MNPTVDQIAAELNAAYSGALIAPLRTRLPEGALEMAYAIQQAQIRRWCEAGRRPVGRKIGLTSPAVQQQLGVAEPDFGQLFADMVYGSGEGVPMSRLQQPKAEAEIALILGRDLDVPDATVADVIAAVDWVLPALEIVGSRIEGWDINIVDTVADNASSGVLVLGGPARHLSGLDLVGCRMSLHRNGELVSKGQGADCLGGPLNAAAWLARRSRDFGHPLRAGELILTGALGPMVPVQGGDRVSADIEGIGSVAVSFTV